jgi:sugar phosphate isomerase/epimerase
MQATFSRRQIIVRTTQTVAACALGSALAPLRAAPEAQPSPRLDGRKLTLGVATLGFRNLASAEVAKELAAAGIRTIQLFFSQTDSRFWAYNSRADVSSLTPERCQAIADAYRRVGINIHSIGVYTNLIHPDQAERKANLAYFKAMMEVGRRMGMRTFITEASHYQNPNGPEPHVPLHFQDALWPQTVATVRELNRAASKANSYQ